MKLSIYCYNLIDGTQTFIRINKDGNFHRGDLARLQRQNNKIVSTTFPDDPRWGRLRVTLESKNPEMIQQTTTPASRPSTFHP